MQKWQKIISYWNLYRSFNNFDVLWMYFKEWKWNRYKDGSVYEMHICSLQLTILYDRNYVPCSSIFLEISLLSPSAYCAQYFYFMNHGTPTEVSKEKKGDSLFIYENIMEKVRSKVIFVRYCQSLINRNYHYYTSCNFICILCIVRVVHSVISILRFW